MENTISKKRSVKALAAIPLGKPTPGDKTFGIEPAICFYAIKDGDETEEGEEAEILVIYHSSLAASKQNPVKRKLPYIDTFNHEGPAVISAMHDLIIGVFEHLEITSPMNMDKRLSYKKRILRGATLKKHREVLVTCRKSAKDLAGYEWPPGKMTGLSAEDFWTWENTDNTGYDGLDYLS